jgi:hypothetical protein
VNPQPATSAEAVANAFEWFENNSGWAPPDEGTLEEWAADHMARAPDDCEVEPHGWCEHGLASWPSILSVIE